ncbi:Phage hypothetical protein [Opitutaceae bacterium TAV1]|nr:Phage hypothetical protein [Opitutaceae bacterium TAV1]
MKFPIIDHLDHQLLLLLGRPDTGGDAGEMTVLYSFPCDVFPGETGRETRVPRAAGVRLEQSCGYFLKPADAAALRASIARLDDKRVAVPLWCDISTPAGWPARLHATAWAVNIDTGTLLASEAVPQQPGGFFCPLLVGKFRERPEITALTEGIGAVEIAVVEDSPPGYAIGIHAPAAPAAWPGSLDPDWTDVLDTSDDGRKYEQIGRIRERNTENRERAFAWGQQAAFTLRTRGQIRDMLAFFAARRGRLESFAAPVWFRPGPDEAKTPHVTRCRFSSDDLLLTFQDMNLAETSIGMVQLPWEINPPAGEQPQRPPAAFLYRFCHDIPGAPVIWRFTDWETPLAGAETGAAVTWFPRPIEHDSIDQDYQLADAETTITTGDFGDNPLSLFFRNALEAPLYVEIYECSPANPAAAVLRYAGEVGAITPEGRKTQARVSVFGGKLRRRVPSFYFSATCNYELCGPGCGLPEDGKTLTGAVYALNGSTLTVTITVNPTGRVPGADFFAGGWIRVGGELRMIVRSALAGGGRHTLDLISPFAGAAAGAAATLRPACRGTVAECKAWGNYVNFGGHPHMGAQNISLPERAKKSQGGKK